MIKLIKHATCIEQGDTPNVLHELDDIRQWHHQRGFKGGVVLRELAVPLFHHSEPSAQTHHAHTQTHSSVDDTIKRQKHQLVNGTEEEVPIDQSSLSDDSNGVSDARHCYYLYYERKSDGHMMQQVFCRGTTLFDDIVTDLKALYVYDDELECYLHMVCVYVVFGIILML